LPTPSLQLPAVAESLNTQDIEDPDCILSVFLACATECAHRWTVPPIKAIVRRNVQSCFLKRIHRTHRQTCVRCTMQPSCRLHSVLEIGLLG
jgi:hypothetical protein